MSVDDSYEFQPSEHLSLNSFLDNSLKAAGVSRFGPMSYQMSKDSRRVSSKRKGELEKQRQGQDLLVIEVIHP